MSCLRTVKPRHLIVFCIIVALVSACYQPLPIPDTPAPLPVPLRELLLDREGLTRLGYNWEWRKVSVIDSLDYWEWTNALAAIDALYGGVKLTIVQYGNSAGAASVIELLADSSVNRSYSGKANNLLNIDDIPAPHADHKAIRCETWGSGDSEAIVCAVRLQYDMLYVQLVTPITDHSITVEDLQGLVHSIDDRMQPIWEPISKSASPYP